MLVLLRYYVRAMHKCSCSPAGATVNGVSAGVRQQTLQSEGYGKYESPPKLSLFMAVIAVGIAVVVFPIEPGKCQNLFCLPNDFVSVALTQAKKQRKVQMK